MTDPCKRLILFGLMLGLGCKSTGSQSRAKEDHGSSSGAKLSLNDVSMLLPIFPTDKDGAAATKIADGLRAATLKSTDTPNPAAMAPGADALPLDNLPFLPSAGLDALNKQVRLDDDHRDAIGADVGGVDSEGQDRNGNFPPNLVAAAIRFDPCVEVRTAKDDDQCTRQIRIIWRSAIQLADDQEDVSVHALYRVDRPTFSKIVDALLAMQQASGKDYAKEPLERHPVMLTEGADGPYFKAVLGLLHRYVRASNLQGMAGLAQDSDNEVRSWVLTAIAYVDGQPVTGKAVVNAVHPLPKSTSDNAPALLQRVTGGDSDLSSFSPTGSSPDAVTMTTKDTTAPENPTLHDVRDIDCVSCHLPHVLHLPSHESTGSNMYTSSFNLKNTTTDGNFQTLEMFGTGRDGLPIVQQRVINESARVADYINQTYLGN